MAQLLPVLVLLLATCARVHALASANKTALNVGCVVTPTQDGQQTTALRCWHRETERGEGKERLRESAPPHHTHTRPHEHTRPHKHTHTHTHEIAAQLPSSHPNSTCYFLQLKCVTTLRPCWGATPTGTSPSRDSPSCKPWTKQSTCTFCSQTRRQSPVLSLSTKSFPLQPWAP